MLKLLMQASASDRTPKQFHIVGIGASAGGLEALIELFEALDNDTGMAFVVVQHLEPRSESHLAEILTRSTKMPVVQAHEGEQVEPDHVYVIPPNTVMIIEKGALHLAPRPESPRPHYPIDAFLESLANDHASGAIGLILSGSASDGAQGIRLIKIHGGTTFAQDERSAKYGGMPHSAIATGAVDFVLPPAQIAEELRRIDSHPYLTAPLQRLDEPLGEAEEDHELLQILDRLKSATRVDFSNYKVSTIRRRLGRRMVVHHLNHLREYLEFLDSHPGEIHELYRDILICVTSFFREPEMFESLAKVVRDYLVDRGTDEPFRIWTPGCATGEEAYSLAMIANEVIQQARSECPVQVFGTDISDTAIDRARAGVYNEKTTTDVSPERLQRFFTLTDSGYRINQAIRDCCVFAKHDLTSDPPFSQMDLVSCRNVFIYLSSALQQRVLPALHYSLKPSGLLILGSAETVGNRSDLFGIVDQDRRIYVKRQVPSHVSFDLTAPLREKSPGSTAAMPRPMMPAPTLMDLEARAARILRDLYAPAGVLINGDMQILHFHGHTGFYLEQIPADGNVNLLRVAREDLLSPIRRSVAAALEQKQPVRQTGIKVRHEGQARDIDLSVIPLSDHERSALVLFEEKSPAASTPVSRDRSMEPSAAEMELGYAQRDLAQTKDYLRKVIEQHDAVTEELRSANEEARSSNEELQSTNEELRTAKEQLQSTNEELITVNDELQHRNRDLSLASNDLRNILSASMIPVVMVGMDLRLRRSTPSAERLLGLVAADIGRLITDIHLTIRIPDLGEMLAQMLHTLAVQQKRVQDREGRWFDLFIRPYRTMDERIDGAVLTFIDVDDVTRALKNAEEARRFADGITETVQHPLLILDASLRVTRATQAFFTTFGVRPDETLGHDIDELGNAQWSMPELRRLLQQAVLRDVPFRDFEVTHDFPHIGRKIMRLNARRIPAADSNYMVLLAIEDVTERQESAQVQYRRLFESAKDGIIVLSLPEGTVLDVNPYFLEMCRYPIGELRNKPFRDIAPFVDDERIRTLVEQTRKEGTSHFDSVRLRGKDGREALVEIVASRYQIKDQGFVQLNVRDVTDRRHSEDRLRQANIDLQQFAFAASHDLQEPLRTITNYLELLKREFHDNLSKDAETSLAFIFSATDRMRQLVLDLLGYSHVVRADLHITRVSPEAALSVALMNLQMAIQASDARITFDHLPVVEMDETQLVQLLQNLISNSIKYRGPEPPQIHISAREAGPDWAFSVRDNGIGIDMKYADQIFAVFKRLHGGALPGSGVGLAICKKILERRGGRIWVESESGHGSTFHFTIPKIVETPLREG
ncbi:MAG TPA: chemotaxis protein CheB [Bryobacteraceae bacterium]